MKRVGPFIALLLAGLLLQAGCVGPIVYAPQARELTLYKHAQDADFMSITQDIQPRIADEMAAAMGKIEGNNVLSPSGNNVASPNTKVGIK